MLRNDFLTAVNHRHGICGFISFYMSFKDYRHNPEMMWGDEELARTLDECIARYHDNLAEPLFGLEQYVALRRRVLDLSGEILDAACTDANGLRAETLAFSNPFILYGRGCRPWTTWDDVHSVGLGVGQRVGRAGAIGVALTNKVVKNILVRNKISFEDVSPVAVRTEILLTDACANQAEYRYCLLGIGPEYYAPKAQNAAALEGISHAGLLHWIYVDRNGDVSNYGATRPFASLLDDAINDAMQSYTSAYGPNNWCVKHKLSITFPQMRVAVLTNNLRANAGILGDASIPIVRYATGDDCAGKPDEFNIQGNNFRGDKNVSLKIFQDGQQAPTHTIVVPYKKISFKQLADEKKAETTFETDAINPQVAKLEPGSYIVKAYVDDAFETECKFSVLACESKKKPVDGGTTRLIITILIGLGLIYVFYLTAKRRLLAVLAQRVITMVATNLVKNPQGLELYEYIVLKEAPALAHKDLFSQSYKGVTINEGASEYTITGTADDLLPLFKKLDELPVVYAFPAENDTYTYHPNKRVNRQELLAVLNEEEPKGDKHLLTSPSFLPTQNLLFGQKLSMGQFFYDPRSNRLLIFQRDRNLVLYDITDPVALTVVWAASTNAKSKWDSQNQSQCYLEITREAFRIHDGRTGETPEPLAYKVEASANDFSFDLDLAGSTFRLTSNQRKVMESPASKTKVGLPYLAGLIETNGL